MKYRDEFLPRVPLIALIAANLIPIWGVLFAGWDAFYIVLLYWAENLAVGSYNVLKMAFVKVPKPEDHLSKLFMIPFFIIHFGGFTGVHGIFVLTMSKRSSGDFMQGTDWPCFLVFVQMLLRVIGEAYSLLTVQMKVALLALFASHGVSFVYNYFYRGEYARVRLDKLMGSPYTRVVIMHIAIIAGGFISIVLDSPAGLLFVLVVLKTIIDVKMHLHEHRVKKVSTK